MQLESFTITSNQGCFDTRCWYAPTPQLEVGLTDRCGDPDIDTGALPELEAATAFLGIVWRR